MAFPSTTSLVSYWKLDEASGARADSHGSNNLTDNNTVGSAAAIINNGAVFVSANTEYLSCTSNATLQMSGNTDFTITAWVNLTTTVGDQSLVTKDDDAPSSRDYTLDYGPSSGNAFRFYIGGGFVAQRVAAVSSGVWYFLVAWYDSSNGQCHLRIDDAATFDSTTGSTGAPVSAAQFRIGAREYASFEDYSNATIDEVSLWKRILTAGEITALYNGGAAEPYVAVKKSANFLMM